MPKKSINKFRGLPQSIRTEGETITIHEPGKGPVEVQKGGAKLDRKPYDLSGLINTPPPYGQAWLDANGLVVVYTHGRAVLQYRK